MNKIIQGKKAENFVGFLISDEKLGLLPQVIGGTWPTIDVYVEIIVPGMKPFFFVQVKSTLSGYTAGNHELKVKVPKLKVQALSQYKAPTYLIGVDMKDKVSLMPGDAFILTIRGKYSTGLNSMPSNNSNTMNSDNLKKLRDEVIDYWKSHDGKSKENYSSSFAK